jgi:hypothetical protein
MRWRVSVFIKRENLGFPDWEKKQLRSGAMN